MAQHGDKRGQVGAPDGGQLEPVEASFPALLAEALARWAKATLPPARQGAKRQEFASKLGVSKAAVGNWINDIHPPRGDAMREAMLSELARAEANHPCLEPLARACMARQGITDVDARMSGFDPRAYATAAAAVEPVVLSASSRMKLVGPDATIPVPWTILESVPRKDGFASLDAHPPQSETPDRRSVLNISISLRSYEVPEEDGASGFPVTLTLTGTIELIARWKHVQAVPFSHRGDPDLPAPNGMVFGGGVWSIDLARTGRPSGWPMRHEPLCDMHRTAAKASVTVELRCLPRDIDVQGLPQDPPTTKQALLRRLFQFPTVNTENDRIPLAYSVIAVDLA